MGRPVRALAAQHVHRICNDALPRRSLALGGAGPRDVFGVWLCRALARFPVELFGAMTLPRSYEWLLRGDAESISAFVGYVQGNAARVINEAAGVRRRLWSRARFATEDLGPAGPDLRRALVELLARPHRAGYRGHPRDWPLFNSYPELVEGRRRSFCWLDRTAWYRAGRPEDDERFWRSATLRHARLPEAAGGTLRRGLDRALAKPGGPLGLPSMSG